MTEPRKNPRRRLVGIVRSDKMMKTVTVIVSRRVQDPLYRKYLLRDSSFKAHDAEGVAHTGDTVEIEEHRPYASTKRWKVIRVLRSALR